MSLRYSLPNARRHGTSLHSHWVKYVGCQIALGTPSSMNELYLSSELSQNHHHWVRSYHVLRLIFIRFLVNFRASYLGFHSQARPSTRTVVFRIPLHYHKKLALASYFCIHLTPIIEAVCSYLANFTHFHLSHALSTINVSLSTS
jgi:hypothetical protein